MKTILVPVDYSPNSKTALLYALKMAQKAKLKVVVFHAFHAIEAPPAAYEIPTFIPELEKEKKNELEQYVNDITRDLPIEFILNYKCVEGAGEDQKAEKVEEEKTFHSVSVEKPPHKKNSSTITTIARIGTVQEQIMHAAQANEADLVVMGMHGGGGVVSQALLGSTTLSMMRDSKVPVLGIPLHASFRDRKSVVFASDLKQQPDELLLLKLRDFVKTFVLKLEVLHLHRQKNQKEEYRGVERALHVLDQQLHDVSFKVVLKQREYLAEGIQEYLQAHASDLLILSPHRHSLWEKLQNKSITAQMVSYGSLPLLTLPASKKKKQEKVQEETERLRNL